MAIGVLHIEHVGLFNFLGITVEILKVDYPIINRLYLRLSKNQHKKHQW